jgi:hypothetical protein
MNNFPNPIKDTVLQLSEHYLYKWYGFSKIEFEIVKNLHKYA